MGIQYNDSSQISGASATLVNKNEQLVVRHFIVTPSALGRTNFTTRFLEEMERVFKPLGLIVTFRTLADEIEKTENNLVGCTFKPVRESKKDVMGTRQDLSLMGLPFEVRCQIWELLLTNSDLSNPTLVSKASDLGRTVRYNLHPAVLRLSRSIQQETLPILYGNTFYVGCLSSSFFSFPPPYRLILSPLTRYLEWTSGSGYPSITTCAAVRHVRQWKIVISTDGQHENGMNVRQQAHYSLFELCRAIHGTTPKIIEVAVIQKGVTVIGQWNGYAGLASILKPLELIRNLEKPLLVRDATALEICDSVRQVEDPRYSALDSNSISELVRLKEFVAGDSPCEVAFKMNELLVEYAQAFEIYPPFRQEMAFLRDQLPDPETIGSAFFKYRNSPIGNPYRRRDYTHPIELGLINAREISAGEDLIGFKVARRDILKFLEKQYLKIQVAGTNMIYFIRDQKRVGGFLDATIIPDVNSYDFYDADSFETAFQNAMDLIHAYSDTFFRHLPANGDWNDGRMSFLVSLYNTTEMRKNLKNLREEFEDWNTETFVVLFKSAIDLLESQYFVIQHARQNLFSRDILNDQQCDIDFSVYNVHERINWTINEPLVGPGMGFEEVEKKVRVPVDPNSNGPRYPVW